MTSKNQNQIQRRALICGASQGIGEATARRLASTGHQVLLLARNAQKLEKVCASLEGSGHHFLAGDISNSAWLESALKAELEKAPITILMNNSGGPKAGLLVDATTEEFVTGFANHVLASHRILQLLIPGMKAAKFGRVVNLISTSVKVPIPNLGVSNTIRAAMANWAKTMSQELGPFGITVNNVLPGFTKTERFEVLRKNASEKMKISEAEVETLWKTYIPAGRFAESYEVAAAITFLMGDEAGYINGINLPVDGGRTQSL